MDNIHYTEMVDNLNRLILDKSIQNKKIYLFGHCNATEELADLLLVKGFSVAAILDNNIAKHGNDYRGIVIQTPEIMICELTEHTIVCIAARAYATMVTQLRRLGYTGQVFKLVEYNSYAEYSLSEDTINRKHMRVKRGKELKLVLEEKYPGYFKILCPFSALGDIYLVMSYLPYFLKRKGLNQNQCVIAVPGSACAEVVKLFGEYPVETYTQTDMEALIQASLYTQDSDTFIPHQDRPYVINLSKVLYVKCIPLEQLYCSGVFGLPTETIPFRPTCLQSYKEIDRISAGNAVVFSPYAKSVTELKTELWDDIVRDYLKRGCQCFTNVVGDEIPLLGTQPISPTIAEIQSVVERAGTFIGIRSGLCDVLRYANCKKVALYPDYNYSDTKWKAIDMYSLSNWKNIEVGEGFQWKKS